MTTLVVDQLVDDLEQEIRFDRDKRVIIGGVYPYLLMHGSPSGNFTFELKDGSTVLLSRSFTSADIKTELNTTHNYAHIFLPVLPSAPLILKRGTYTLKLSASGYTEAFSSFIGWIKQHENLNIPIGYELESGEDMIEFELPYSFRIKSLQEGIK